MPCNACHNQYFAFYFRKSINQQKWKCKLAKNPQTITDLKVAIHAVISDNPLRNVLKNWVHRMSYYQVSRGGHLTETVYINKCHA